ncbi:hypothetical protein HMPREF0591_0361 [Mycobacterium parascrofulaceum ATCC BAA-614]|uniref:Uncharacterized protein n=1 Tax=Mycobacterium parascrofulaceum ATCC BAA-614 TaxID=525368 RepID=D5P2G7_9MYCO|nr:hypothetical protein HMPREF0591_0361 [Mycobacterium parascrofulaceum ATCC BAA-614]
MNCDRLNLIVGDPHEATVASVRGQHDLATKQRHRAWPKICC